MLDFAQYESYRIYTDVFIPSERSAFLVGRIATAPEARGPSFLIRRTGSVIIKNPLTRTYTERKVRRRVFTSA